MKKGIIAVLTRWEENSPNSGISVHQMACAKTTIEGGIQALKELEKEFMDEIEGDCDSNDIIFDEDNVIITRQYDNRHVSPQVKVEYYDEESETSFIYEAELALTELEYNENDEF